MKLTVLVDNYTYIDQYYRGEPAFSCYLETGEARILFDTGYSDLVLDNAEKMGIDLGKLTHIVLSHGHDDHSRGLSFLMERLDLSQTTLVAHPDCFLPKRDEDGPMGAPCTLEEAAAKTRFVPADTPQWLTEDLLFLGEIPRTHDFERRPPKGERLRDGVWEPDHLWDDSALVYRGEAGLFIVSGCAHSGICNIITYAKEVCGEQRVAGVLGGFHLRQADERLERTIDFLKDCDLRDLYPCHCVCLAAKAKMMACLPVWEVGVGMKLELP